MTERPRTSRRAAVAATVTLAVTLAVAVPGSLPAGAAAGTAPTVRVTTVAGTGAPGYAGDGGPAVAARLDGPSGIAVDAAGDLYVADTDNCRVREVPATAGTRYGVAMQAHRIYTVAGDGCTARAGSVGFPTGVAVDAAGNLYVADATGDRILEVPAAGGHRRLGTAARAARVTTVAGTGAPGDAGDGGPAVAARLDDPSGIAVDAAGDLYVADTGNCRVREVPATAGTRYGVAMQAHRIYTVAGDGTCGTAGLGGPASQAELSAPTAVAVDAAGDLLIADRGAGEVVALPVAAGTYYGATIGAGDLAVVAGMGTYGSYLADGLPATGTTAELNFPYGLAVDAAGDLYVADTEEQAIRQIPAVDGTSFGRPVAAGDMYTVLGAVPTGTGDDGTRWVGARVTSPYGLAVDAADDIYYSDQGAGVVREIRPS